MISEGKHKASKKNVKKKNKVVNSEKEREKEVQELAELELKLVEMREKVAAARRALPMKEINVSSYILKDINGKDVPFANLFKNSKYGHLIVVYLMFKPGTATPCPMCRLFYFVFDFFLFVSFIVINPFVECSLFVCFLYDFVFPLFFLCDFVFAVPIAHRCLQLKIKTLKKNWRGCSYHAGVVYFAFANKNNTLTFLR